MSNTQVQEQLAILGRACAQIYSQDELVAKLKKSIETKTPLRVKLGLDPTAPDIHLGHTVVLRRLRQFQDLGHQAVLIIGDATAKIGDPTGKSTTRPVLSDEEVKANLQTYLDQVDGILDVDKLEIAHNSTFFKDMQFAEVMKLAGKCTVARMLERDDFNDRYSSNTPISLHEFFYPLMQGWDSVMVRADVELGGTDQTFNNLMGRDLQRAEGQEAQVVMILPILCGLDGVQKMSKSLGNYIALKDTPEEMFGKVMSIPDDLMQQYFELLTDLPADEIAKLVSAETHPRKAKEQLARTIVTRYFSADEAENQVRRFEEVFSKGNVPDDMPEVCVPADEIWIVKLLQTCDTGMSGGDARRMIQQGGVKIDGEKIAAANTDIVPRDGMILQIGKRKFYSIKVKG